MQPEEDQNIVEVASQVAADHFARSEREAAQDLIRDAFRALPWELQELYQDYLETYRKGEREKASRMFDAWMDRARELGMI